MKIRLGVVIIDEILWMIIFVFVGGLVLNMSDPTQNERNKAITMKLFATRSHSLV